MKARVFMMASILLLSVLAATALATDPAVILTLNQSEFKEGDTMALTLTTSPGTADNNWDVYIALILPDGAFGFMSYEPTLNFALSPVTARPLRAITQETRKILEITFPSGMPAGNWLWGSALAKPDLSIISQISWAPFNVVAVQPPAVNITGTWTGTWLSSIDTVSGGFVARIAQQGSTLSGTIDIPWISMFNAALKGTVSGTTITFGDVAEEITFTGTVSGTASLAGTYTYPFLSDHGTWQAAKSTSPGGSCLNVAGTWSITEAVIDDTCGGGLSPQSKTYTMTQAGCSITVVDSVGGTYQGMANGTQVSFTGSYPDSGGVTRVTAASMTVSENASSMTGSASWTWSDGIDSCSGTSRVTGTRR